MLKGLEKQQKKREKKTKGSLRFLCKKQKKKQKKPRSTTLSLHPEL